MNRIDLIDKERVNGRTRELLESVEDTMGMVPNIVRALANSPAVLEGYLAFSDSLARGGLDERLRERISLAVSERNGCTYCLCAHTALAQAAGLSPEEIHDARRGGATDRRSDVAVKFALSVLEHRGAVSDRDIRQVQEAGFPDAEMVEIIAIVALNIFNNYFNHVVETQVDFPPATIFKQ